MSKATYCTDAMIARMLTDCPAFREWTHQPLEPQWRQQLNCADRQTLMTLVAEALSRLMQESSSKWVRPGNGH